MAPSTTIGNAFADYLFKSKGEYVFALDTEKENIDAFIDFFEHPFLFSDESIQQQLVEIRCPIFSLVNAKYQKAYECKSSTCGDGASYLNPGQLLSKDRYKEENGSYKLVYYMDWASDETESLLSSMTLHVLTTKLKYTFDLKWNPHGLILVSGKWERLDDPSGMRLFSKSEMESLGLTYSDIEDN